MFHTFSSMQPWNCRHRIWWLLCEGSTHHQHVEHLQTFTVEPASWHVALDAVHFLRFFGSSICWNVQYDGGWNNICTMILAYPSSSDQSLLFQTNEVWEQDDVAKKHLMQIRGSQKSTPTWFIYHVPVWCVVITCVFAPFSHCRETALFYMLRLKPNTLFILIQWSMPSAMGHRFMPAMRWRLDMKFHVWLKRGFFNDSWWNKPSHFVSWQLIHCKDGTKLAVGGRFIYMIILLTFTFVWSSLSYLCVL